MSKNQSRAQHIAKRCITEAKATLGDGWKHVSHELQWGLIAARILSVFLCQDEENDPKSVRDYITQVADIARDIHDNPTT